jgi:hypothetical protein
MPNPILYLVIQSKSIDELIKPVIIGPSKARYKPYHNFDQSCDTLRISPE